jgi:hypothetical protein
VNNFEELKEEMREELFKLGETFSTVITPTAITNQDLLEGLLNLKQQLEMQRAERRLDVDALRAIVLSMGSELSSSLDSSISSILASTGKDDGTTSSSTSSFTHKVSNKMDILIGMVTNVTEQVSACAKYLSQIRNITSKIAKNQTHYPPYIHRSSQTSPRETYQ